jgi:chaperonin GroEL
MESKLIESDSEMAKKILSGVEKAEKAVCSSLGPAGRPSLLSNGSTVKITKDGISIFDSIVLKDPFENAGVIALREASAKTNTESGDGTTSVTSLAASIYKNGLKYISMNANPVLLKRGIEKAAKKVVENIRSMSKSVKTKEEIKQVALVSANNDEEIAEVIAEVLSKIGDATVRIEGGGTETSYKIVEGLSWDKGYFSPMFATNEKLECNLENPLVMITDLKLTSINQIMKPLQSVAKDGRPLLIICESIEGDCLSTLILNRIKRGLPIAAVGCPSYGSNRKGMLRDIAALVGGKVISEETGLLLEESTVESGNLGIAKSVIITKGTTTIIGSDATKDDLAKYVSGLKAQLESLKDEYEIRKLTERIAKLSCGIGKIYVGAHSETELSERRDRVIDAYSAAKSSLKEGVVPGGSLSLIKSIKVLREMLDEDMTEDERIGVKIMMKSLESPARKIYENAGQDSSLIVEKLLDMDDKSNVGYDALNNKYTDMFDAGIVDPTFVEVSVVQNAVSVATLLLTSVCAIVTDPETVETPSVSPMV